MGVYCSLTNLQDEIYHDKKTGPKVVKLIDRLKSYGSDLTPYAPPEYALRRLELERTEKMLEELTDLFSSIHGIPNPGQWKMIAEVIEGRFLNIHSKLDNYTCSELVAESYIKMGLLKDKKAINGFMPKDFSTDGNLKLLKGSLSGEIYIDING